MKALIEYRDDLVKQGYSFEDANARLCQDIILKALSISSLSSNVTIKGGVVMRSISKSVRRATQDIDIDFIRYSLSNDSIDSFVKKINIIKGISIKRIGEVVSLKQHDYHGKRIFIEISDEIGNTISSKIDFGVHNKYDLKQEEYCFDVCISDDGASLLINSLEQMYAEKLASLLKFGEFSTRYKDIYDMYYISNKVDIDKLEKCFKQVIYDNQEMRVKNIEDIKRRVTRIFGNENYVKLLLSSNKNWVNENVNDVLNSIIMLLESIKQ